MSDNLFIKVTTKLVSEVAKPANFPITFLATIICLIYNCIADPEGAINQFMIIVIDMIYSIFPSTPQQYTIGYMLRKFSEDYPIIGWGVIYEIFVGMAAMFGLWCIVKLWQLLPFT